MGSFASSPTIGCLASAYGVVKPGGTEALVRLALGVAVCVFMGVLGLSVLRPRAAGSHVPHSAARRRGNRRVSSVRHRSRLTRKPLTSWKAACAGAFSRQSLFRARARGVAQKLTSALRQPASGRWSSPAQLPRSALVLIGFFLREHQFTCLRASVSGMRRDALWGWVCWRQWPFCRWPGCCKWDGHIDGPFDFEADAQTAVQMLRDAPSWINRVPLGIVAILVAPPAEEMMFRGLIYPT